MCLENHDMEPMNTVCVSKEVERSLVVKITKSLRNTTSYLQILKKHDGEILRSFKEARYEFLKVKFSGKEPLTPIVLDVLQRYDVDYVTKYIASNEYTMNEKAHVLVNCFGDTFKGLCQFVRQMLIEKGKMAKQLRDRLLDLHLELFGTVCFLERFRDLLHGKRDFQSIFSASKLAEFDKAIADWLSQPKPDVVRDHRNWCVLEQVYVACDSLVEYINPLLMTLKVSHL